MSNNELSSGFSVRRTYQNDEDNNSIILHIPRCMAESLDILNCRVLVHMMKLKDNSYLMISKYTEEIILK
jgi:hypothetical protein